MANKPDMERLARLAGLRLTREEAVAFAEDLVRIGDFLAQLAGDAEPMVRPGSSLHDTVFRPDRLTPAERRIDVREVAPEVEGDELRVPPVLGEDT